MPEFKQHFWINTKLFGMCIQLGTPSRLWSFNTNKPNPVLTTEPTNINEAYESPSVWRRA